MKLEPDSQTLVGHASNVALRVGASGGRFVLLVVMARTLTTGAVGVFGLVAATVLLATYVVGFDYYTFTTREVVAIPRDQWAPILREQLSIHLPLWAMAIPLALVIGWGTGLPVWATVATGPIIIADHFSLELHRVLIAARQPLRANTIMFLRSGLWGIAWSASAVLMPEATTLNQLWAWWLASGVAGILLGLWWLRDVMQFVPRAKIDRSRRRQGLAVARRFLASSLAIRAMLTVDRYLLEYLRGPEDVGVYTLFIGIANIVLLATEAGVAMVRFPDVVAAFRVGDVALYRRRLARFRTSTLGSVALWSLVAAAGIIPVLAVIGDPAYRAQLPVYWMLLIAVALYGVSQVPHYALYAQGQDRPIVMAAVFGLGVAVVAGLVFVPSLGARGSALATLLGFGVVLVTKLYAVRRHASPEGSG